jgi:hypothetical protein
MSLNDFAYNHSVGDDVMKRAASGINRRHQKTNAQS